MVIIWLVVYSILFNFFKENLLFLCLILYSGLLYLYLYKSGKLIEYRLRLIDRNKLKYIGYLLPFIILPFLNIINGKIILISENLNGCVIGITIITAIMEELFFRGWLRTRIRERYSLLLTSSVFGICHIISDVGRVDILYIIEHIIFAVCFGVIFFIISAFFDSLIPSAVLHILININAFGEKESSCKYGVLLITIAVIYMVYSIIVFKLYLNREK